MSSIGEGDGIKGFLPNSRLNGSLWVCVCALSNVYAMMESNWQPSQLNRLKELLLSATDADDPAAVADVMPDGMTATIGYCVGFLAAD